MEGKESRKEEERGNNLRNRAIASSCCLVLQAEKNHEGTDIGILINGFVSQQEKVKPIHTC